MSTADTNSAPEIALYRQQARIIDAAVRVNLDGIAHQESLIAPKPAGSCPNWVLGHLTHTYEQVLPFLGRERVLTLRALERYKRGSPPLLDPAEAYDFARLMEVWDEAAKRVDDGLQALTLEELARSRDYFGAGSETTLAKFLNFIFFHQAYHSGQLGVLRRIVGKEGAIP